MPDCAEGSVELPEFSGAGNELTATSFALAEQGHEDGYGNREIHNKTCLKT